MCCLVPDVEQRATFECYIGAGCSWLDKGLGCAGHSSKTNDSHEMQLSQWNFSYRSGY